MSEWVYVPKEATKEMIKAGEGWSGLPSATWSDMIDAAPVCDEDQMSSFMQEAYNQGFKAGMAEAANTLRIAANGHDDEAESSRKVLESQAHQLASVLLRSWANGIDINSDRSLVAKSKQ